MRTITLLLAGVVAGTVLAMPQAAAQRGNAGIGGVNHVGLSVEDVDAAVTYYTQTLGFPEAFRAHDANGNLVLVYVQVSRDTFIEIQPANAQRPPGISHLGIVVEDMDAAIETLRARGAEVSDSRRGSTNSIIANVTDPNGIRVELSELPPESLQRQAIDRWQAAVPDLEGMWSDPPPTLEDGLCFFFCTEAGIARLFGLLDDPANDERPYSALAADVSRFVLDEEIRPRMTEAALASFPLDPADDRGFLHCEPWGLARQVVAPHQLEIRQLDDRVEMHYGEWNARRTIYLDGREHPYDAPSSTLGHSIGRYEDGSLVIETRGLKPDIMWWRAEHSGALRVVETYRRSPDGERLLMTATLEDPWSLKEPLTINKVWGWAPEQKIYAYDACEPPTEFSRGVSTP